MRKRATRKLRSSFPVPSLFRHTVRIGELAIEHRLPTMFIQKDYVRAGGLMSYGVDFVLMAGRTGDYVAKILKGAKAGDLPVEEATKFAFVVNLKTARAIGIELPTGDPAARRRGDRIEMLFLLRCIRTRLAVKSQVGNTGGTS